MTKNERKLVGDVINHLESNPCECENAMIILYSLKFPDLGKTRRSQRAKMRAEVKYLEKGE